jgi:4-amino-4-deoxy-L-arabinose transferase-like glycosyltransferase
VAAVLIGLLALVPRVAGLDDFYTIDEGYHWPGRVENFSAALASADWAGTNQSGHPGVTTMWLGALGRAIAFARGVPDPGWAGGGATYLALLRMPLAVANALAVLLGFLLLGRIVGAGRAFLAGTLWASAPFVVAHSRLLHLDALLTSLMTLSLLALLAAYLQPREAGRAAPSAWLRAGSGVCAGLALLTKAPALILLPVVGLSMLLLEHGALADAGQRGMARLLLALRRTVPRYLAWLAIAAGVVFVAWPAMWVAPQQAIGAVIGEIVNNGGQPHDAGNFFLGRPVADPGPLFYLAVLALRTDPLTALGLLACVPLMALELRGAALLGRERQALLVQAGYVVLFTALMSVEAKKLDRYLLPIWPALAILAACGLWWLASWAGGRFAAGRYWPASAALALVVAAQAAQLAFYFPYFLAFYNPLAGGGQAAERTILVGMGEGMDQVGAWLRRRPDLERGDVLSWIPPTLAPFVPRQVLVRDLRPEFIGRVSSYAVLYVRSVQHKESAEAEAAVRATPALFTIRIHGITYAEVHQLPRPYATAAQAVFDDAVRLRGFSQQLIGSTLVITPSWSIERDRTGGAAVFVHILDRQGRRVAQVDAALDQGMFATWQAGQQFDSPLPLALPPDLAPGQYRIVLGVYEPGGARLRLTQGTALADEVDGPQALELGRLNWPP